MEELFDRPYRVIDILPERVPEEGAARYAALERFWLAEERQRELRMRFAHVLMKLNCYAALRIMPPDESRDWIDADPETLSALLTDPKTDWLIHAEAENCLITLNRDDTCMTVYGPSEELVRLIGALAASEGLFLRTPEE